VIAHNGSLKIDSRLGVSLRVLIVELQGRGGFWHYANALCAGLAEAGVVTALATTAPFEDLGNGGVPILIVGERTTPSRRLSMRARRVRNHFVRLLRLNRTVKDFRPHIVHLHGPLGAFDFVYIRWLKYRGVRVIYTAHNPRPRTGRMSWLHKARLHEVDAIVALSRGGVKDLVGDGIQASKVFQTLHGNYLQFCSISDSTGEQAKRLLRLPEAARVVLFFGQIAPYKGLELLIEAFAQVRKQDPNAYLVVAGTPVQSFAPYQRLIDQFGFGDSVILELRYIPLSDLPKYFLAADLVVFPYRHTYQSGVLQLAYGFARPVVVTDAGDLGQTVTEDGTGIVAEPNPEDLAAAIQRLLSERPTAALMGQRGRQAAETKYSWAMIAARTADIYRSVCGVPSPFSLR
jgi:glycosyltransferase involved in cell wall biosynthesis